MIRHGRRWKSTVALVLTVLVLVTSLGLSDQRNDVTFVNQRDYRLTLSMGFTDRRDEGLSGFGSIDPGEEKTFPQLVNRRASCVRFVFTYRFVGKNDAGEIKYSKNFTGPELEQMGFRIVIEKEAETESVDSRR